VDRTFSINIVTFFARNRKREIFKSKYVICEAKIEWYNARITSGHAREAASVIYVSRFMGGRAGESDMDKLREIARSLREVIGEQR
jgi:hypothetical protein